MAAMGSGICHVAQRLLGGREFHVSEVQNLEGEEGIGLSWRRRCPFGVSIEGPVGGLYSSNRRALWQKQICSKKETKGQEPFRRTSLGAPTGFRGMWDEAESVWVRVSEKSVHRMCWSGGPGWGRGKETGKYQECQLRDFPRGDLGDGW